MKTIIIRKLGLAAAVVGVAASASAEVFNIQGYVNFNATTGVVLSNTFGITTGDSFTGTLTYDSSSTPYYVYGPGSEIVGYQPGSPLISFTVRGQNFSLFVPEIYVFNELGTSEIATAVDIHSDGEGWVANTPWGSFGSTLSDGYFKLINTPGFVLPDTSLPTQLDISDWSTEHDIYFARQFSATGADGRTIDAGIFGWDAEITSITAAPEPGTMAILGLGAMGCVLIRRRWWG
jgi:hypothetical protein